MAQHDLDVANAAGNVVRADINAALAALGTHQKGPSAPGSPAAGWIWVDDNTPSASVWTVFQYDGSDWIIIGWLDTTNNRYTAAGAPIWGGTAGGTANALTVTTSPPIPARWPGMIMNFTAASANTSTATLNDNALGAVSIRRPDGSTLLANDILAGESIQVVWDGSYWRLSEWPDGQILLDRRSASASAQVDISLPSGFSEFELHFDNIRPSVDGGTLFMRTTTDAFGTVASSAGDYVYSLEVTRPAATTVDSDVPTTPAGFQLSTGCDTGNAGVTVGGKVRFTIGDGVRYPRFRSESDCLENAVSAFTMLRVAGVRNNAAIINGIRLFMDSGNISTGRFRLYGVR